MRKYDVTHKEKKKCVHRITLGIILILISIIVMGLACFLFVKSRESSFKSVDLRQSVTDNVNYTDKCNLERTCDNCSYLISCVNLIENMQEQNLYFKIKNQKTVKIECTVQLSVKDKTQIVLNKAYKIGYIEPDESKVFVVPFNYSIEKFEFSLIPDCK